MKLRDRAAVSRHADLVIREVQCAYLLHCQASTWDYARIGCRPEQGGGPGVYSFESDTSRQRRHCELNQKRKALTAG